MATTLPVARLPVTYARLIVPTVFGLCLLASLTLCGRLLFRYNVRDYDEGVYWASLRSLSKGHVLFAEVFSSQPPLFLMGLLPGFVAFGHTLVAARAMILAYAVIALVALYWAARRIAGPMAGWIAVLLLSTYPRFVNRSVALQAEVPTIALELTCLAVAIGAARATGKRRLLMAGLSGAALAAGILNKLPAVFAAIPALCYLLGWRPHADPEGTAHRSSEGPSRTLTLVAFVAGSAAVAVATLAPFWEHRTQLYQQVVGFHLAAEGGYGGLSENLNVLSLDPSQAPIGSFAIVCLVTLARNNRRVFVPILPILLWGISVFAFLLMHHPLFGHHLLFFAPPLVLLAALSVARPSEATLPDESAGQGRALMVGTVVVAIVGTVMANSATNDQLSHGASSRDTAMVRAVQEVTRPGEYVVSDNQYIIALAGRDVPPELVDTSNVRFAAGSLTEPQLRLLINRYRVCALLFATARFSRHTQLESVVQTHFRLYRRFGRRNRALYVR